MDFWQRARTFAEEAAKKSQELTQGITTVGATANFSDAVSEASKRSREFAAEASKKSKEFAAEALKRADQIAANIPPPALVLTNLAAAGNNNESAAAAGTAISDADLEVFGVTDELREFVKGITTNTFRDFPLEDDSEVSDIPAVSNVRQDLTEWQEKHAKLVLSTVKEISKLRYQLCPRVMKERKFWRIYFILVNSHVAPYEKRYTEAAKLKPSEKVKDAETKDISPGATSSKTPDGTSKPKTSNAKSAGSDQDLDVFLLGDLEDSDGGPDDGHGDGDDGFEDDFDKI